MNYSVRFNDDAISDIEASMAWGFENWGDEQAERWIRGIYAAVQRKLSYFPLRFPLAPESREFSRDVRCLLHGRYRILFVVEDTDILVLHVTGPYSDRISSEGGGTD